MSTLILLPCHGIYKGTSARIAKYEAPTQNGPGSSDKDWELASFQIESQDQLSFLYHIYASLHLAEQDPSFRVVFSGGYTKKSVNTSESASYLQLAKDRGLITSRISTQIYLEEYARDSYENVLFSLIKFRQETGKWPIFIKIIGLDFKKDRFLNEHLKVLQFPLKYVEYIGIGPIYPPASYYNVDTEQYANQKLQFLEDLEKAEEKNALGPFKENPFGCKGSVLYEKKLARDPFNRKSQIVPTYTVDGETATNAMLTLDDMILTDAETVYNRECKGKFAWCERAEDPLQRMKEAIESLKESNLFIAI